MVKQRDFFPRFSLSTLSKLSTFSLVVVGVDVRALFVSLLSVGVNVCVYFHVQLLFLSPLSLTLPCSSISIRCCFFIYTFFIHGKTEIIEKNVVERCVHWHQDRNQATTYTIHDVIYRFCTKSMNLIIEHWILLGWMCLVLCISSLVARF